jgi:hypothetical protein
MNDRTKERGTRADKVVKDLLEHGWSEVTVGATTVVYQRDAPIREREHKVDRKTKKNKT